MVRYTRANNEEAVQKIHQLRTNPPAYEVNQRVHLLWADTLGNTWTSNFVSFALALEFIEGFIDKSGEIVAINAGWW
tara:strand:- start:519 stop:749 length:231 start_codon:yes stop_codon:yes gene_type:complete